MSSDWRVVLVGVLSATTFGACGGGSGPTQPTGGSTLTTMPAPARATVRGQVAVEQGDTTVPVGGATVELVGSASVSTSSGADGAFALEVPVGVAALRLTAPGYWGALIALDVPASGVDGIELALVTDADVEATGRALGRDVSTANGLVVVVFENASGAGGESASITAPSDPPFVIATGVGYAAGNALRAGSPPVVTFTNVPPGTTGVTATGASGRNTCTVMPATLTAWPVEAKVITYPRATCM